MRRIRPLVMFVPSEAMAAAAFSMDPDLMDYAMSKSVLINPNDHARLVAHRRPLLATTRTCRGSHEIYEVSRELYKRVNTTVDHFVKVGGHLSKAAKAYDATMNSYERRVLPRGRRPEELKVSETLQGTLQNPRKSTTPRSEGERARVLDRRRGGKTVHPSTVIYLEHDGKVLLVIQAVMDHSSLSKAVLKRTVCFVFQRKMKWTHWGLNTRKRTTCASVTTMPLQRRQGLPARGMAEGLGMERRLCIRQRRSSRRAGRRLPFHPSARLQSYGRQRCCRGVDGQGGARSFRRFWTLPGGYMDHDEHPAVGCAYGKPWRSWASPSPSMTLSPSSRRTSSTTKASRSCPSPIGQRGTGRGSTNAPNRGNFRRCLVPTRRSIEASRLAL